MLYEDKFGVLWKQKDVDNLPKKKFDELELGPTNADEGELGD
jgi:hypothetical protein